MYKYNGFTVDISDSLIKDLNKIIPTENIKVKN